jgi:hypothetical protein
VISRRQVLVVRADKGGVEGALKDGVREHDHRRTVST